MIMMLRTLLSSAAALHAARFRRRWHVDRPVFDAQLHYNEKAAA
jgi:hypothetical protein